MMFDKRWQKRKNNKRAKKVPDLDYGWKSISICKCGKRRYKTRKDAKRNARSQPDKDLKVYKCPLSNGYHLGTGCSVVWHRTKGKE